MFLVLKKRLRHALIQGVTILIRLIAKLLFTWSFTHVNNVIKTSVKNTHMLILTLHVSSL